ncbi:MAG TPA: glutamate mutase L, partial [bacterium]|nr:glutamate mutase L [bacterium]
SGGTLVDMMRLDILVGSGGVLSHAPRRVQAAFMLIDGFRPEGVTQLAVDSIFMMPQLGVLAQVEPKAALEVFHKDCLIRLGTCVAPVGIAKGGAPCVHVRIEMPGGKVEERSLKFGEMALVPLAVDQKAKANIRPARGFDVGAGKGKELDAELTGGVAGVIIDARGRPLNLPEIKEERVRKVNEWNEALGAYPRE